MEITSIEFLTPARLKYSDGGVEHVVMANVDIINRKVYDANGEEFASKEVFAYMDEANGLPEDFFAAPDEIRDMTDIDLARQTPTF